MDADGVPSITSRSEHGSSSNGHGKQQQQQQQEQHHIEPLPLSCVNHLSRNCKDIRESLKFYVDVLGFVPVKRPNSLDVKGAWLFNYGIGIHLLQKEVGDGEQQEASHQEEEVINPRDDHISFQCEDVDLVEKRLQAARIKYEKRIVKERGIEVDQIFFHDPDGFMIEVCTCERLPVEPIPELPEI